jgi:TrmH family RNA methyltransferase
MRRIDSVQNSEIKLLSRLKERRIRQREGRFIIEGAREILRAMQADLDIMQMYHCSELLSDDSRHTLQQWQGETTELSRAAFEKISHRENPDGLIVVALLPQRHLDGIQLPADALVLVLEGLEKPGNLGALLRTADGVGVDAIFVVGNTDLYNPNVIRASMGSVFTQSIYTTNSHDLQNYLQEEGFTVFAATPHAQQRYWDAQFRGRVAIALGAEHQGLSGAWMNQHGVSIPMQGTADSLNVATAGALLLYEALRQRS